MVTSLNTLGHPKLVPDSNKEREISLTNSNTYSRSPVTYVALIQIQIES